MKIPSESPATKNAGVQILRGLAAMAVVIHHSLEESRSAFPQVAPDWMIILGAAGVDIFFVISGFIIYSVTFRPQGDAVEQPAPFLLKRLIRIFPIYWVCLFAVMGLWLTGLGYQNLHPDTGVFLCSLFLLHNQHLILGVAWTLVYETYFYYLFTLALFTRKADATIILTLALLCCGLFLGQFLPAGAAHDFLSNRIVLEFCYGLALAHMIRHNALTGWGWKYAWLPALILMGMGSIYFPSETTSQISDQVRFFVWGLPAVLIVLAFIKMDFDRSLTTKVFVLLGDASYSLYLTHPLVMIAYATLIKRGILNWGTHQLLAIPLILMSCIGLGLMGYQYVEYPLLNRLRHWFGLTPRRLPLPGSLASK